MKFFVIALGQAGGKILDLLIDHERMRGSDTELGLVINTARTDLMGLKNVPVNNRILIGQTFVKGHGVGTDNKMGSKVTQEEIETILNNIDAIGTHNIDAFLIVAGLGGGTGSGGSPVIAKYLSEMYSEPVYTLGILPAKEEGKLYTYNAAKSIVSLVKYVDHLILLDNSAWKQEGVSLQESFQKVNEEVVRMLGVLKRAGEPGDVGLIPEMAIDSSEVIHTLRGGGITSIGYATVPVETESGKSRFKDEKKVSMDDDRSMKVSSLVRRATLGRQTLPCDVGSAERALILVAGPPEYLDRKGLEKAKLWLEEQISGIEVRSGDYPTRRTNYIAALVILANLTEIPRVRELQKLAAEAKEEMEEAEKKKMEERLSLFDEDIEPLI